MLRFRSRQNHYALSTIARLFKRFSTSAGPIDKLRNVGILAHIDAGKTTTTERLLYYTGVIRSMGEVHDGDTVMDFTPQERDRGITIGSAAISFPWQNTSSNDDPFRINLIDTPGHIDFTMEVERSVRVLDGAITVLDAVAGVEAQTETIWAQAEKHSLPRLAFVNKLDRVGASLSHTCASIADKLNVTPLVVQLPLGEADEFHEDGSLVDLVTMQLLQWKDRDGDDLLKLPIINSSENSVMATIYPKAVDARNELVQSLADFDEEIGDKFLMEEDISSQELENALRRVTLNPDARAIVTLCGSALKNRGMQPLLDAITSYLPSPLDRSPFSVTRENDTSIEEKYNASTKDPLCALIFKITHDRQRGPIAFFRLYSGAITTKTQLLNSSRNVKERLTRLLTVSADDMEEVDSIDAGNIGAIVGLKGSKTGDTLVSRRNIRPVVLPGVVAPEPVFSCSIEAESSVKEKALSDALYYMTLEDPSLAVTTDDETGQTLLHGMGELHLEVIQSRLETEYKLKPTFGPMRVAFRESIVTPDTSVTYTLDTFVGTDRQFATVCVTVSPIIVDTTLEKVKKDSPLTNITWKSVPKGMKKLPIAYREAINEALALGILRGPLGGYKLSNLSVTVDESNCTYDSDSNAAAFKLAAAEALRQAILAATPILLEPVATVRVSSPDKFVGDVLSDLNAYRRAQVLGVNSAIQDADSAVISNNPRSIVDAECPLANMVGYATDLRSKTKGEADFSMKVDAYQRIEIPAWKKITGKSFTLLEDEVNTDETGV